MKDQPNKKSHLIEFLNQVQQYLIIFNKSNKIINFTRGKTRYEAMT